MIIFGYTRYYLPLSSSQWATWQEVTDLEERVRRTRGYQVSLSVIKTGNGVSMLAIDMRELNPRRIPEVLDFITSIYKYYLRNH